MNSVRRFASFDQQTLLIFLVILILVHSLLV
jgi:hypothetical protein